jgi:hypothetical protein
VKEPSREATTDAEKLADAIRRGHEVGIDAGLAAPADYAGDQIEVLHEPPQPADGVWAGPEIAALWQKEGSMLRAAMADAALTDVMVTAQGHDAVVLQAMLRGTTPDGNALNHAFRVLYTLDQGRIVRALASYDPAPVAALNARAFQQATPQPPGPAQQR